MFYFVIYLIIMNLLTCILYGVDKMKAIAGARRTPEKVLLGFTCLGGSVGALVGMQVFRHKTRHLKFQLCVPLCLVLHTALVVYVYMKWFA